MSEQFFALVKLPATTHVYGCLRCGALIAPSNGSGGDGTTQHRRWHASVDSGETVKLAADRR